MSWTSTSLDPALMQLINMIAKATVAVMGGQDPVSLQLSSGPLKLNQADCSAITLSVDADSGVQAKVVFSFAGSPFTIQGFLDPARLGALMNPSPNAVQAENSAQLGPGNAESADSPGIQKQGSGKVVVRGQISGTVSPQATVTVNLYRDGTGGTLFASAQVTPGGAAGPVEFACDLGWLDTLPDTSAHHYTIQAVGSGGAAVTIAANGASVLAFEL